MAEHLPVLVEAVVGAFGRPLPGAPVVDGTCGLGGHSSALLQRHEGLRLVCLDRDSRALGIAAERLARFGDRAALVHGCFGDWLQHLRSLGVERAAGLILDLGVSSMQLDEAGRGFSFRAAGPLDMRMDAEQGEPVLDFLRDAPDAEIARVIYEYGEERLSRRIASGIKRALAEGRLRDTLDLAEVCRRAYPRGHQRIDPATRTFQALRIHVNDELGELRRALAAVPDGLTTPAMVAVISFHSLEDRIVKHTFRDWERAGLARILKPAPIVADEGERGLNPRSRSAKLRLLEWGVARRSKAGKYRPSREEE
ncbi:MAG: 16S rRNA (cytosine(1402)-N(4))-methyltransferase RsmH [Planctomycetes bacterium]|nr:16S rRNA (cytosine(1402)-N(4))-methyltransferase RsmH [Planctomycetota bacterium]